MPLVENDYLVRPGSKVSLASYDPDDVGGLKKGEARERLGKLKAQLNELQELLYATEKHALLVVLQGMDTAGKDGVIKHVMDACNPQGCQVTSFKVPTREELAHDFLWRVHKVVPGKRMVGIFNRSHYEDVLVVRVESLVAKPVWRRRYEAINQFEEILAESGVVILKFFLHISKDEQRERLQDRLADRRDHWEFRVGDLGARAKWEAYVDALSKCSTEHAPWYVIPANRKWYCNLVISEIVVQALESLDMEWPALDPATEAIEIV